MEGVGQRSDSWNLFGLSLLTFYIDWLSDSHNDSLCCWAGGDFVIFVVVVDLHAIAVTYVFSYPSDVHIDTKGNLFTRRIYVLPNAVKLVGTCQLV